MQACRFHFGVPVRARGFTTVEILVVVAIFTVSMLLIIPVILHARESARRTACRRNLHNLAIAYEHLRFAKGLDEDTLANLPGGVDELGDECNDSNLLFGATLAASTTFVASLSAFAVWLVVRFFNRQRDKFGDGTGEDEWRSSVGIWFCPPSSSPI
jgi:type II secretory pathway pseudopilin PulG